MLLINLENRACKTSGNLVISLWCTYTFNVYYGVLNYIKIYLEIILYLKHVEYTFCIYCGWVVKLS
jgi:hypothetical protein